MTEGAGSSVSLKWEWNVIQMRLIFFGEQHGDLRNWPHPHMQGSILQEASAAGNGTSGEAMDCSGGAHRVFSSSSPVP